MRGRIITSSHRVYDLPVLLRWNMTYTGSVPCDSYTVTCVYDRTMAEPLHLAAGDFLIREGEKPAVVPFLLKGIVRGFLFDVNGREITDCFAVQPGIPVMTSADLQAPSPLSMDAMVDSDFLTIPIPEIQRLLERYSELQRLYNQLLIASFSMHWEIKLTLCRDTAMQKYQWFLQKYPGLVDQISNKYIASFLGMTPVTLSKLRRVLREKENPET